MRERQESTSPLGMHLSFAAGKGIAALRGRRLGVFDVDRLDLEIPRLVFPFDMSGGVRRFQSRRCLVRALGVSLQDETLQQQIRLLFAQESLSLSIREGYMIVSGSLPLPSETSVPFTARLYLDASHGRYLCAFLDNIRLYGLAPAPSPLVARALFSKLVAPLVAKDSLRLRSASMLEIDIPRLVVATQLPMLGWKIPDVRNLRLEDIRLRAGAIALGFGTTDVAGLVPSPSQHVMQVREALRLLASSEEALLSGKTDEAMSRLRREIERIGEHPQLDLRLAEIAATDPARAHWAATYVEDALVRWKQHAVFPQLLALQAQSFLRIGKPRDAAEVLAQLCHLPSQEPEEAFHANFWFASVLGEELPEKALASVEKLAAAHPNHHPTQALLASLYEKAKRYEDLAVLWRDLATAEPDPVRAATQRSKLGNLYLHKLSDPQRARSQYERALSRHRGCIAAWQGLSQVLMLSGEPRAALIAIDEAMEVAEDDTTRRDLHLTAGDLWERVLHDPESAALRYAEALLLSPGNPSALSRLASIARTRGRYGRAAQYLEELTRSREATDTERAEAFFALAELFEGPLHDVDEACTFARKTLDLAPYHQDAQNLLQRHRPSAIPAIRNNPLQETTKREERLQQERLQQERLQQERLQQERLRAERALEEAQKAEKAQQEKQSLSVTKTAPQPVASPMSSQQLPATTLPRAPQQTLSPASPKAPSQSQAQPDIQTKNIDSSQLLSVVHLPNMNSEQLLTPVHLPKSLRAISVESSAKAQQTTADDIEEKRPVTFTQQLSLDDFAALALEEGSKPSAPSVAATSQSTIPQPEEADGYLETPTPHKPLGMPETISGALVTPVAQKESPSLPLQSIVPKRTEPTSLQEASRVALARGQKAQAAFYHSLAAFLSARPSDQPYAPVWSEQNPPEGLMSPPRELFLALAPEIGGFVAAPTEEALEDGPMQLREQLFSLAAKEDAAAFAIRWGKGRKISVRLSTPAVISVGVEHPQEPLAEMRFRLAKAICSIALCVPVAETLSAAELEELLFLMAVACDPITAVADEGALSPMLRASIEQHFEEVLSDERREELMPAVSTLLDAYESMDFEAFRHGLLAQCHRKALCLAGDLTAALCVVYEEEGKGKSRVLFLEENPLAKDLLQFSAEGCQAQFA